MESRLDPDAVLERLEAFLRVSEPPSVAPNPPQVVEPRYRDKPARILVADDNQDYRRLVRKMLMSSGYEVFEARDGREGLALAAKTALDLLVLDFEMPGCNGYEVLQELRRRDETRKLPVVLVTGAAIRHHLRELNLDVAAFLDKPVPNGVLLEAVARVLNLPLPRNGAAPGGPPALKGTVVSAEPAKEAPPLEEATAEEEVEEEAAEESLLLEEQRKEPEEEHAGLEVMAADSPVVNRVNRILVKAVQMGASDIHIEPQEKQAAVRVRVDGSLRLLCRLPSGLMPQLAARIKIMSNLVITERRRPQDGQVRAVIKGKKVEFRVSTLPSLHGEKIVLRILGGASLKPSTADLGLRPRDLAVVRRAQESPHGLILVTGPTGSGKTTTLYTMLRELSKPEYNIMTAEDPVEYELPDITQVPIRAHLGMTFEAVLRSFLRQDPDIMLVGEIRDRETAEIAVKAAITGHLVLSTLHTNTAPGAVMRLTHMGVAGHLVADSVKLLIAQRLVRRLCPDCRAPAAVSAELSAMIGPSGAERLAKAQAGRGCKACGSTGYKGRMPLFEVMEVRTPEMRQMILAGASLDQLTARAVVEGLLPLKEAALDAVAEGKTSVEEALTIVLSE